MQPETKNETKIEYPYLPEGRTILYVGADNPFILEAQRTCFELSTDLNHPHGAVIVLDGKIVGRGALQAKIKNKKLIELHAKGWCPRKILKIKSGEGYWMCPGCASYDDHSEAQALKNATKNIESVGGSDLYFWGHWWCCEPCWKKMINAGIKNVYLLENSHILFNRFNPQNKIGRKYWKEV